MSNILSNILELCEQHMSEGDYLLAAETLKKAHEGKAPVSESSTEQNRQVYIFPDSEKPSLSRQVEGDDDDSEYDQITIVGYAKYRPRNINHTGTQILYKMGTRPISYVESTYFKETIINYLTFQNWTNVNFKNYFGQNELKSFSNFLTFFKEKEKLIMMATSYSGEDYLVDEELDNLEEIIEGESFKKYCLDLANKLYAYTQMLMELEVGEQQSS